MSSTSPTKPGKQSSSSTVHQKLSLLTASGSTSSSSSSKPFIKSKSQTTSSLAFPSFRFSPDSEEIQEITTDGEGETGDEVRRASVSGGEGDRTTPPPQDPQQSTSKSGSSGGDISPLKEYILKHKWANKWEKRSLSLDLDLKGKIITAIEDKRRSFVSHFYNEEDEAAEILRDVEPLTPNMITSSCSIPEQLVASSSTNSADQDEEISTHSDSLLNRSRKFNRYNFDEENNSDYFDDFDLGSSSLPNTPITNLVPDDLKDLIVEEIGVDCCEDTSMVGEDGKVNLSLLREFVLPPEFLQERFQGLPTLYNPPSVVKGLRKYPLQEAISEGGTPTEEDEEVKPVQESEESVRERERLLLLRESHTKVMLSAVISKVIQDLTHHPGVKYWIGILAVVLLLDMGRILTNLIWFGLGAGGIVIANQVLWKSENEEEESSDPREGMGNKEIVGGSESGMLTEAYWRSQGWMLALPPVDAAIPFPDYDAFSFHLRNTKSIFVRLDGPNLLISHPHPRHRIPKRRLWDDPLITSDIIFIKHQHYNIYGAKVEIVPTGLAKKRCWCKKYPIAITLACKDRYVGKLTEVETGSPVESESTNGSVSFSKDDKGNGSVKVAGRAEGLRGEVHKEEGKCWGKTLYLFARTDREKDDWFRRLVAASKHNSAHEKLSPSPRNSPDFTTFIAYMKRACPTLHIPTAFDSPISVLPNNNRSTTPTNVVFETMLISSASPPSGTSSPASSRKSTPEHVITPSPGLISPSFLNALIARMFYDFLRSPKWINEVKQMIDRKLFFLRKPKIIENLKVKALELGDSLPVINHASFPVLDRQGLWVDLDISFTGSIVVTIEAFVNLLNMGSMGRSGHDGESSKNEPPTRRSPSQSPNRAHAMFDSDADDSGESSESEEELELEEDAGEKLKESAPLDNRGKMFKYAEAISKSSVMRNKHVQKVVGNIAATPFVLTVEIKRIVGSVAVNIPPVPNDRVWIGFRTNPEIDINARPKVGERVVSLSQVTGWIKKKLLLEFQRVMVCPNMMDITVPLMEFELPK